MTMFGLLESDVATLARAVADDSLDNAGIRDRFARSAWIGIAEPGDRIAGMALEALGAAAALDAMIAGWSAQKWQNVLAEHGVGELAVDDATQAIQRWQPRLKSEGALRALETAVRFGARLLTPDLEYWPEGLSDLGFHAPLALWMRGTDAALASLRASIALVGARSASRYGEDVTVEASAGLVDRGYAIVSGAAYGIDGTAHRVALASHGQTVAFLAGGVDRFYPSGHDALLTRIVAEGAIMSELPPGEPPTKWRFLQRNRLIAAASQATVVIEAGWRSGSLNTAGHASALGRPLGAVPGPIQSATSAGCHRLIRDYGATLVSSVDEMAELAGDALGLFPESAVARQAVGSDSSEVTRLLDAMSYSAPRVTSDIAARAGLSVATVQSLLGTLELDSRVAERERGWVRLKLVV